MGVTRGRHNAKPTQPGERFEMLVVIRETGTYYMPPGGQGRAPLVLCRCDCGKERTVTRGRLQSGRAKSCGCRNFRGTHRMHGTPAHTSWRAMIARCTRKADPGYHNYGGRGIAICEKWKTFRGFYADMGDPPASHTLDRIDNNGNYEPSNCRWATPTQQMRNARINRLLTLDGERLSIAEWAERFGLCDQTIRSRLNYGWAIRDVITAPRRPTGRHAEPNSKRARALAKSQRAREALKEQEDAA